MQVDAFSGPGRAHLTRWLDQAMFAGVAAVGLLASTLMLVGSALAGLIAAPMCCSPSATSA